MSERMPEGPSGRLHRYYLAAGATLAAAPAAHAAVVHFDPPGGLPIIVDTSDTLGAPIDIDLDGDLDVDFQLYYSTNYGGGFAIQTLGNNRVMSTYQDPSNAANPWRYEYGEPIRVSGEGTALQPAANTGSDFNPTFIDGGGQPSPPVASTELFRGRPGFIGLALREGAGLVYAGALRIAINADGTEMAVLGGLYETSSATDITQLAPLADGFEDPLLNGYFPPAPPPGPVGAGH